MNPAPPRARRYWLLKSEPGVFSFDDLWRAPRRTSGWDGVRNHQARNFMTQAMAPGDGVLVYHSGASPGIAGVAEVASAAYPDPTQFEQGHEHFEPRATRAAPVWFQVDVRALRRLPELLPLERLRAQPPLARMGLLRRGNRLSVQPVTESEWAAVLELAAATG